MAYMIKPYIGMAYVAIERTGMAHIAIAWNDDCPSTVALLSWSALRRARVEAESSLSNLTQRTFSRPHMVGRHCRCLIVDNFSSQVVDILVECLTILVAVSLRT